MNCASAWTRPRSISSSVGPSAASRAISSRITCSSSASVWPGRGGRGDLRVARHLARVLRRRDVGRHPLVEHQPAIEARRLAVGEQVGRQIEIRVALREHRRREPRQVQPRQLDAILELDPDVAGQRRRRRATGSTRSPASISPKYAIDERQRLRPDRCRRRARATRWPGDSSGGRTRAPRRACTACRSAISPIVVQWYG